MASAYISSIDKISIRRIEHSVHGCQIPYANSVAPFELGVCRGKPMQVGREKLMSKKKVNIVVNPPVAQ